MSKSKVTDSSATANRKRTSDDKPDKSSKRVLIFLFILLLILLAAAVGYKYPEVAKVINDLKAGAISVTVAICVVIFCLRIIWKDVADLVTEAKKNQTKK
jgi:ACR3 family arsenite efflux pump ArsB